MILWDILNRYSNTVPQTKNETRTRHVWYEKSLEEKSDRELFRRECGDSWLPSTTGNTLNDINYPLLCFKMVEKVSVFKLNSFCA